MNPGGILAWQRLAAPSAFVGPVILFQDFVPDCTRRGVGNCRQIACDLEPSNGGRISGVLVGV
jgi:hypothetical protein